jgi:hypothetical protein
MIIAGALETCSSAGCFSLGGRLGLPCRNQPFLARQKQPLQVLGIKWPSAQQRSIALSSQMGGVKEELSRC